MNLKVKRASIFLIFQAHQLIFLFPIVQEQSEPTLADLTTNPLS